MPEWSGQVGKSLRVSVAFDAICFSEYPELVLVENVILFSSRPFVLRRIEGENVATRETRSEFRFLRTRGVL